jgi:hypothetical protein
MVRPLATSFVILVGGKADSSADIQSDPARSDDGRDQTL